MPRAIWKGSISFGLVTIPVELHTAVRDHRPKFRMLHARDKSPVRYERVCQREGKPVAWEDLVKGYRVRERQFVVLTKEDLKAAALNKDKAIDIMDFVKSRRDRRSLLRDALLPDSAKGRAARLRAAARRAQGVRTGRHREDHHSRGAASGGARGDRQCAGADDAALCRRAGRYLAARVSGERQGSKGRARHGEDAHRQPRGRMGSIEIHRRVPRQPDEADQGAHQRARRPKLPRRGARRKAKVVDLMERLRQSLEARRANVGRARAARRSDEESKKQNAARRMTLMPRFIALVVVVRAHWSAACRETGDVQVSSIKFTGHAGGQADELRRSSRRRRTGFFPGRASTSSIARSSTATSSASRRITPTAAIRTPRSSASTCS